MKTYPNVPIVMIEAAGPVTKSPLPKGTYGQGPWKLELVYVLEDGRRLSGVRRYRLKRDAVAEHDSFPAPPPRRLEASFDETGHFWGTRETFSIGPSAPSDVAGRLV